MTQREYETAGYVIAGQAELTLEGRTINLKSGDSWLVPAQAKHAYRIQKTFTAIEATAPPAQVHGATIEQPRRPARRWTADRSMKRRSATGVVREAFL
ncbi:cupin domain-containing protein [Bradyrhizobium sp. DASA03120]|uniref:cupin domain-containing protein n=1 Tax=Bradyrhizobium sp. SMVTL-02 TaxID=3395917 RepID=UPI003F6FE028